MIDKIGQFFLGAFVLAGIVGVIFVFVITAKYSVPVAIIGATCFAAWGMGEIVQDQWQHYKNRKRMKEILEDEE